MQSVFTQMANKQYRHNTHINYPNIRTFMEFVKKINFPMLLLGILSLRMLLPDASIAQSLFSLGLIGLFGYDLFLSKKHTKSLDQKVREELDAMKSVVSGMAVKTGIKPQVKENTRFF